MMMERIGREHGYMKRLLAILDENVQALQAEKSINYLLIKEIVDYLAGHSEHVHHPKEDLMYHYYNEHYGTDERLVNLAEEHATLSIKTQEFLETVDMVLQDAIVPQDRFIELLESFIAIQHRHLSIEELNVLPKIEATFTPQDWQYLESQWQHSDIDPVFGEAIENRYLQLAHYINNQTLES